MQNTDVFPSLPHNLKVLGPKTYAEMVFSRGSGGRPTVSCFWWDNKSAQAYVLRRERLMREGSRGRRRKESEKTNWEWLWQVKS